MLMLAAVLGGCGVSAEPPASAAESSEAVSAEDETSGEASDELIRVENLRKSYGTINVLNGVSTSVRRGETVSVIGPFGGGKSTFLRCLNLLEQPTAGR